jgi:hypothetical protein
MPRPYQELNGIALAETLKQRRDSLPEIADRFYRFLASQVDVQGTDKSEHVEIRKLDDKSLEVSVALQSEMGTGLAPYFRRRFLATETQEIRIYLRQGADTVTCGGLASSPITVYVIGNQANDVMAQCNVAGIRFMDAEQVERNLHPIPIEPDPRRQFPPVPTLPEPWDKPRDWGAMPVPIPWFSIGSDYGLFLGGGLSYERFGFGKVPYAQRHLLRGGYAFGINEFKIDYEGSFRYLNPDLMSTLGAGISGIEVIRFYGFGNNTSSDGSDSFFKTEQLQFIFTPALQYSLTPQLEVFTGLQLKYAHTDDDADTLLNQLQPYGVGKFGQLRFHTGFDFDTRDRSHVYGPGVHLHLQGMYYPEVWDVQSHFGAIEGTVAGYLSLSEHLLLALRLGGKHVFGTFPFHEAAYVGGSKTVRGYRSDRFAGDSSLFANTELRVDLGKAAIVLPAEWGVFVFGDVGRVFVDGESSKTWHPAGGGGVYTSILDRSLLLTLSVARSEELTVFFLKTEFTF